MAEKGSGMKLAIGELVRVVDAIEIDSVRGRISNDMAGQFGVVEKCEMIADKPYYYIVTNCGGRLWATGIYGENLVSLGFRIEDLIDEYARWLSDRCWKNTDHTDFDNFCKRIKEIRKKWRAIVKERML